MTDWETRMSENAKVRELRRMIQSYEESEPRLTPPTHRAEIQRRVVGSGKWPDYVDWAELRDEDNNVIECYDAVNNSVDIPSWPPELAAGGVYLVGRKKNGEPVESLIIRWYAS